MARKSSPGKRPVGGGRRGAAKTSWDPLAAWYDGWVGKDGSRHHQKLAVPAVMALLGLTAGERVLDIGAGQGALAPAVRDAEGVYVGVDASPSLIERAQQYHGRYATFHVGDARRLESVAGLATESFDAAVFLLSIQDMEPIGPVLTSAAAMLKPGGRLVLLMTHPCFRIPRQSGWGWDENRKLQFRRVDRYLTPLAVPLKPYPGQQGVSRSYHRPLEMYVNGLAAAGLWVDQMKEIPTYKGGSGKGQRADAEKRANDEIPLFVGLRARKPG